MVSKRNYFSYILITFLIFILIKSIIVNYNRNINLENKSILFTVGTISKHVKGAKVNPWFIFNFAYRNEIYEGELNIEGELRGASNVELDKYIGKKYFVKFSEEKPKYSEIYFDKPVPKDFIYTEGQTWKNIPIN